jgi:hypothetical protein
LPSFPSFLWSARVSSLCGMDQENNILLPGFLHYFIVLSICLHYLYVILLKLILYVHLTAMIRY